MRHNIVSLKLKYNHGTYRGAKSVVPRNTKINRHSPLLSESFDYRRRIRYGRWLHCAQFSRSITARYNNKSHNIG